MAEFSSIVLEIEVNLSKSAHLREGLKMRFFATATATATATAAVAASAIGDQLRSGHPTTFEQELF